jgi:hypothetical protein
MDKLQPSILSKKNAEFTIESKKHAAYIKLSFNGYLVGGLEHLVIFPYIGNKQIPTD